MSITSLMLKAVLSTDAKQNCPQFSVFCFFPYLIVEILFAVRMQTRNHLHKITALKKSYNCFVDKNQKLNLISKQTRTEIRES